MSEDKTQCDITRVSLNTFLDLLQSPPSSDNSRLDFHLEFGVRPLLRISGYAEVSQQGNQRRIETGREYRFSLGEPLGNWKDLGNALGIWHGHQFYGEYYHPQGREDRLTRFCQDARDLLMSRGIRNVNVHIPREDIEPPKSSFGLPPY